MPPPAIGGMTEGWWAMLLALPAWCLNLLRYASLGIPPRYATVLMSHAYMYSIIMETLV